MTTKKANTNNEVQSNSSKMECFVIMPISDGDNYEKGHFKRVYDSIITPGVEGAGFEPYRADDNNSSRLIHIDIIKKLIEAPMAICDLTTRNPNVLYELGIRQAFDKPVFLIQEKGTERIFDINGISTIEYEKGFDYESVVKAQKLISAGVRETYESHDAGINSLISLMNISSATISNKESLSEINNDDMFKIILNEINNINRKVEAINSTTNNIENIDSKFNDEYYREILNQLFKYYLKNSIETKHTKSKNKSNKDKSNTFTYYNSSYNPNYTNKKDKEEMDWIDLERLENEVSKYNENLIEGNENSINKK